MLQYIRGSIIEEDKIAGSSAAIAWWGHYRIKQW